MSLVFDQMNRSIEFPEFPKRIISLVPSQTELLYELGLGDRVLGITRFCIHPKEWFKTKTRIGGTKKVDFERIDALKPDLIIGNKEENTKADIEQLEKKYPVWMSDIYTLEDNYKMMELLGVLLRVEPAAQALVYKIKCSFDQLQLPIEKRAAYFIWKKPYMVAAKDTFIHHLLYKAGFENAFKDLDRYPMIDEEILKAAKPDVIFLSSEPYPFKEKHLLEFQAICPDATIKIIDGELFSWYGSRLLHSAAYFKTLYLGLK